MRDSSLSSSEVSSAREPMETTPAKTLLLTGATGFLGSEIIVQCLARRIPLRCVARSHPFGCPSVETILADLTSAALPPEAFANCEQVLHVAGLAHQFGKSGDDVERFHAVNVVATEKLAKAAALAGVKHFILISSVAVYGEGVGLRGEDAACDPRTPYALSKLAGEVAARQVCEAAGMHLTILRPVTLYGEADRGNTQRLIKGVDRGTLPFFGPGQNRKSLMHVEDAACACLSAVAAWNSGERRSAVKVLNLAGQSASMADVYQKIRVCLGKSPGFLRIPLVVLNVPLRIACRLPGIGKLARRVESMIEKWTRDDAYDGGEFERVYGFAPRVDLLAGLQRQTDDYILRDRVPKLNHWTKRAFDFSAAVLLMLFLLVPMLIVAVLVRLTSPGPIVYYSNRVGKDNRLFAMPKFRTMKIDTPQLATHLLGNANQWLTPIGGLLRKTSLDELPQLFSVLRGHMSFVGPRPALFNQDDLVALRDLAGVSRLRPGITGWAQINGRDELSIPEKVVFDQQYVVRRGLLFDLYILFATVAKVFLREGVRSADDANGISDWIELAAGPSPSQTVILTLPELAFITASAAPRATIISCRNPNSLHALLEQLPRLGNFKQSFVIHDDSQLATRLLAEIDRENLEITCIGLSTVCDSTSPRLNHRVAEFQLRAGLRGDELENWEPERIPVSS